MCQFFSLVSNGDGKALYFDAKLREEIKNGKLNYQVDSHTSIADYFGYKGKKEDKLNKYEYNPFTKVFKADQINNTKDDSQEIKEFCEKLDFELIIPQLRLHPVVHPFRDFSTITVFNKDIKLLKRWNSVGDSVGDSVRNSVRDSVWDSVGDSVRNSVRDSVWDSVGDSVRNSVRDSVRDSVWASVWAYVRDSVWASVWAYVSSFFDLPQWKYIKHEKGVNPFQCCIDLWNKGLVPSFDGKIWRLHGKGGKIVYEIEKEKLNAETIS